MAETINNIRPGTVMFYSFGDNSTTKLFIQSSAGPRKRKSSINIIVTNVVAEVIGYCGSSTQQNNKYPKKPQTLIVDHASHGGGQRWRRRRTWPIIIIIHREHFGLLTKSATETEATMNSTTLLYWISCTTRDKNLLFLVNPSTTNAASIGTACRPSICYIIICLASFFGDQEG